MCEFEPGTEAVELYNYISNTRNIWHNVEFAYRNAERAKRCGEYVPEYLEANLFSDAISGAIAYCREYCPQSDWRKIFTFAIRRECAKLLVKNFETEIDCGNGWLGRG